MSRPLRIFISCNETDERTALDLQRQLALAFQPAQLLFWDRQSVPVEAYRASAAQFLESADLFVAVLSMNYEDSAETRFEMNQAVAQQRQRPGLQIVTVTARAAHVPAPLRPFLPALPPGETIEQSALARDRQLSRAAASAVQTLRAAPKTNDIPIGRIELPISIIDLRERLLAQTDRINHAPLLALLKRLIQNVMVKRVVLDVEDAFKHLREQTRLSQISIAELEVKAAPLQMDLQHLIENLDESNLVPNWRAVFIRDYYHFTSDSRDDSTAPPFFVPVDDVIIPETLNLPVGPREQESLEQIGLLSFEQKNDFRRNLLLAKDALAVKNPALAFSHCDHVRRQIDPQSAQLYEYLLITYIQQETPMRAMEQAVAGNDRLLQYILLYASRLRDYQREGKCPSSTALHNLAIASESISDAALRMYYHFPNDPLRHTGKHAEDVPDNRQSLRVLLDNTLKVCRLVHPSEELIEAAVIESCGGGKCHWLKRVDVVGEHFQFIPDGHFDLLGEIQELLYMLEGMEADHDHKIVKGRGLLREDLFYSLLAKRQALRTQLEEDIKRRRPYTDLRESVVRFTYSCLLGAHIFGDEDARGHGNSFYRLALEYLLPGLLTTSATLESNALSWFTLDENGRLAEHPDCADYDFDVMGIVQKIIRDHAGKAAWIQVQPNIQEVVYLQYRAETDAIFAAVAQGLSYTDFRRMDALSARRQLIEGLQRLQIAYQSRPEQGRPFLEKIVQELCGDGLMLWLQHDPVDLSSHPDSLALGFDAAQALREAFALLHPAGNESAEIALRERIAANLFQKKILPAYNTIKRGDHSQRQLLVQLIQEILSNYKLHPDRAYLNLIWSELTEETKLPWVDITEAGGGTPFAGSGLDALALLRVLHDAQPEVFNLLDARERIADRRHNDQVKRYLSEISEFRFENRQPERQIAIEIIQKLKGIYLFFPKVQYLELAWDELYAKPGKHRIRWNATLFGFLPLNTDHYENQFHHFNYKFERFELKRLLDNQYNEMQRVLQETGI